MKWLFVMAWCVFCSGWLLLGESQAKPMITAAQYCIIPAAQSYNRTLPIFAPASSCTEWRPVSVTGGTDSANVSFTPSEITTLPPGWHTLYLQFQDDHNVWGPARKVQFEVHGQQQLVAGKFFLDKDGDPATGGTLLPSNLDFTAIFSFPLDSSSLLPCIHTLYLHIQDNQGNWGPSRQVKFEVTPSHTVAGANFMVVSPDTFPSPADPTVWRVMNAVDRVFNTQQEAVTGNFSVPTLVDYGIHAAYVIAMDSDGRWTKEWNQPITITPSSFYVGNRLNLTTIDSDNTTAGNDGMVTIPPSTWLETTYQTPPINCVGSCTDIYSNNASVTLTAVIKPWIDNVDWTGCTVITANTCQVTMDALKNVTVRFRDTLPPKTVISTQPLPIANSRTSKFSFMVAASPFEDTARVSYRCLYDGDPTNDSLFYSCSSPTTLPSLQEGQHTLWVKAVDKAGNIDPTPASYSWVIDVTPPVTTASISGSSQLGNLLVTLATNEPASIYLTTDGSTPSLYSFHATSPFQVPIPTNMTLSYFSQDLAGNLEPLKQQLYATTYQLNLIISGSGGGNISSTPSGYLAGSSDSVSLLSGNSLTLQALPNEFSQFSGWNGDCTGGGSCLLSLPVATSIATKNVTANFGMDISKAVVLVPPDGQIFFNSPQRAYDQALGGIIGMWGVPFIGDLTANRPISVNLRGGMNNLFTKIDGMTVIKGAFIISNGQVVVENLTIQ